MLIVLYLTCILVSKIKPYRKEYLNKLHYIADFAALLTFGIAVSLEDLKSVSAQYMLFFLMVSINFIFIVVFGYNFIKFMVTDFIEKRKKAKQEKEYKKMLEDIKKQENEEVVPKPTELTTHNQAIKRRKKTDKSLYKFKTMAQEVSGNFKQRVFEDDHGFG